MIDRTHKLPVVRQCQILALSHSTASYQPQPVSEMDLALMRRIDTLHLEWGQEWGQA
jgi:putative transposase